MCLTEEGVDRRMSELKKALEEFKKEHKVEKVKVIWVTTALHFRLEKADQNEPLTEHIFHREYAIM
jgi:hypothetical protein